MVVLSSNCYNGVRSIRSPSPANRNRSEPAQANRDGLQFLGERRVTEWYECVPHRHTTGQPPKHIFSYSSQVEPSLSESSYVNELGRDKVGHEFGLETVSISVIQHQNLQYIPLGGISTLEKYKRNNDMMWVDGKKGLRTTFCNEEIELYDRSSMRGFTVTAWKQ